jgi:hypothetical protein
VWGGGFGLKHFKNVSRIDGINLFNIARWAVKLLSEIKKDSLDANSFPVMIRWLQIKSNFSR